MQYQGMHPRQPMLNDKKAAFVLRDIDGHEIEEVSEILGMPEKPPCADYFAPPRSAPELLASIRHLSKRWCLRITRTKNPRHNLPKETRLMKIRLGLFSYPC
jgi:hypothetical protein